MSAKYMTITLDENVVKKLDWICENSSKTTKSGLISRLLELEFLRLKKAKLDQEELN